MMVNSIWMGAESHEWEQWDATYNIKYSSEFNQYCKYMHTLVVL